MTWGIWLVLLWALDGILAKAHGASGAGVMILYQPRDISNECAFSTRLRYDLSFGMGMSDTITLVFRTLADFDYECLVDIKTNSPQSFLITVLRFPTNIANQCKYNPEGFAVVVKDKCLRFCDILGEKEAHEKYFVISFFETFRFRFTSNSTINANIGADMFQVTVTAARLKPAGSHCSKGNETICTVKEVDYCFTTGVVCDGIKNCGVSDWFDERKSFCGLPVEKLGTAPVMALTAVVLCIMLGVGHVVLRLLPIASKSFFIFNANEDNRLCMDTVCRVDADARYTLPKPRLVSLIPISSSTSGEQDEAITHEITNIQTELKNLNMVNTPFDVIGNSSQAANRHITAVKNMTSRILNVIRGRSKQLSTTLSVEPTTSKK